MVRMVLLEIVVHLVNLDKMVEMASMGLMDKMVCLDSLVMMAFQVRIHLSQ